MFSLNYKNIVNPNPKLSRFIQEHNERRFKNYSNGNFSNSYLGLRVSDLVKEKYKNNIFPNSMVVFISFISFLAGYNFRYIIKRV